MTKEIEGVVQGIIMVILSLAALAFFVVFLLTLGGNDRPAPANGFMAIVELLDNGDYELVERTYLVRCPPRIYTSVPPNRGSGPLPEVLDVFMDGNDRALVHFEIGDWRGVQLLEWQDGRWKLACDW